MDPTLIAVLTGSLATIVPIILQLITKQRKRISYSIVADVSVPKELEDKIEISSEEYPAQNARLLIIQIRNTGNLTVHPKDYYTPITFEFEDRVISSSIGSTTPDSSINLKDNVALSTRPDAQSIALARVLLKPKEVITISVLVAGSAKHIKVKGRIVDGEISEQRSFSLTT